MAKKLTLSGKRARAGTVKPKKARKLIRKFHVLLKQKSAAQASADLDAEREIDAELTNLGGLANYQQASIAGQSKLRGGDSSKLLVEWIPSSFRGSLLEVGCLQVDNACARSGLFTTHQRIDLNSQHPKIQQLDFMEMTPTKYDVISLSLVVNYVPTAQLRGRMMQHAYRFLDSGGLLFLVLPIACVDNSRYCNDKVMDEIFDSIGFEKVESKKTAKLVYWLLRRATGSGTRIAKRKVRDGRKMNNFSIIID